VGDRGDIPDTGNIDAGGLEGTNGGLSAAARALDENLHLAQAMIQGPLGGSIGTELGSIGRPLPGALEFARPGTAPSDDITLKVGEGDDGVIEGGLYIGPTFRYCLSPSPSAPYSLRHSPP